jgi:hypothetical protein
VTVSIREALVTRGVDVSLSYVFVVPSFVEGLPTEEAGGKAHAAKLRVFFE